jgi:arginine decarboxylase
MEKTVNTWTAEKSAELYNIKGWSSDYFDVSPEGEIVVKVNIDGKELQVSLMTIIKGLRDRGLNMPLLLRIENLVDARIRLINESFIAAIKQHDYQGNYRSVFPIKVNQQNHVIAEIAHFGKRYHHGLEAGSKAELLIALATIMDRESLIVCNGYKDSEFISLGLNARKLGFKVFFVLETLAEMQLVIDTSKKMQIKPLIGVRLKLNTKAEGHWSEDSGDRSLFGMNTSELVTVIDSLKVANLLDSFQLLHFHLGSQISNIHSVKAAVQEACRFYTELVAEGAALAYFDLGGGLAIDYDGTSSNNTNSRNYSVKEYANCLVQEIKGNLAKTGIKHPTIITESGRATVAHTAILLFNILEVEKFEPQSFLIFIPDNTHALVKDLWKKSEAIDENNIDNQFSEIISSRDAIRASFLSGDISLRQRVLGENICLKALQKIQALLAKAKEKSTQSEVTHLLADIYYGNFSVFQSLPDSWAIGQVFPVLPVHRLNEEPNRRGIIADLTCDCDGKLDHFIGLNGDNSHSSILPLHSVNSHEDYILGVFLVGAYQETLGDLHNLFGDTNVASVRIQADGSVDYVHEFHGDSIANVLSYVEYNPDELYKKFLGTAENAVKEGIITVADRQRILNDFSESLRGYTYFEH